MLHHMLLRLSLYNFFLVIILLSYIRSVYKIVNTWKKFYLLIISFYKILLLIPILVIKLYIFKTLMAS